MHPFDLSQQSAQFAADRTRQLRLEARSWRQAHRAAGSTGVTRPPGQHVDAANI